MLKRLARLLPGAGRATPPATLPAGMRVYAVGDIHGRHDLLQRLRERIHADACAQPAAEMHLIYLGDYIDRGPDSRAVIEQLTEPPPAPLIQTCLMGNHEYALLGFLEAPEAHGGWLRYGGLATLLSYGIGPVDLGTAAALAALAERLHEQLPEHHRRFLRQLDTHRVIGDYLFVHAGIQPGVPLRAQSPLDLMTIKAPFINSTKRHPYRVVHGHHITPEPDIRPNRIGIDTGAYASGRLSCVVLEGEALRIIDTR
ncbi:metallophosphoesterase family protein [Marichromatium bheemlicum]|uniref:Serine/threonine protein phosphatase n=1 Tax=Marichromatium bheemlicum TaxID=365339 RepID=A0ABX1IAK4_9GAMM|nr:metallophosphoesterase family protein [Marichromatium bheemlicum]NKN34565.1 serine/threonine protein phosphatase [Marichromatium bheemlicum]